MPDARGTVTAAQHAVLELLRAGPAPVGPCTESVVIRGLRGPRDVRTVEHKATRALAKAGLVSIDAGGVAHLVEEQG